MAGTRDKRKTENKEIETSLLFASFKYGKLIFEIIKNTISAEDFAFPTYKRMYQILEAEYEATGNMISFPGFLKYAVGLPETSDEDKVKFKVAMDDVRHSPIREADVISFCQQLKKHSNVRKFIKTLSQTSDTLIDGDVNQSISFLEERLDGLKKDINIASTVECMALKGSIEKRIEYLREVKLNPEQAGIVWTGFKNLDNFNPPLQRGAFAMFQARTNMGKSMFLMGVALRNYFGVFSKSFHKPEMKGKVKGVKTIVITIEMSAREYLFRMDSHISGFKHTEEFSLANVVEDDQKVECWRSKIKDYGTNDTDILVYHVPENCTPTVVDGIIANNPFKPDLVIIDYIGDMNCGLPGVSNYDWKAQAYLYTRMKQLAGKHKCVIFSAQQTIRGVKKISDETGSASDKASQISDLLIAIEQTEADKLHNDTDTEGNLVEGRLTLREYKVRSGKRLLTHIVPEFYRMNWIEKEFDNACEAGDTKTVENQQKKAKKQLDNTPIERPKLDKSQPREGIDYEIEIGNSPVNLSDTPKIPVVTTTDDAALEAELAKILD